MAKPSLPARKTGTSLANLTKQLADLAAQEREAEPVSLGNFISVKGKQFKFQDAVLGDTMRVIILDHAFENQFFAGAYQEGNPQPPVCYAIGKDEKQLAPPEAEIPGLERQSEACAGCPQNEWASAPTGRGKACKNGRKLAVIGVDGVDLTPEHIDAAAVAYVRLSPTSLRGFSGYLKRITGTLNVPLFGVVTLLAFDEGLDYPSVVTTLDAPIEDQALLAAILAKRETIQDELVAGPDDLTPRESAKKPARQAARRPAPGRATPTAGGRRKY